MAFTTLGLHRLQTLARLQVWQFNPMTARGPRLADIAVEAKRAGAHIVALTGTRFRCEENSAVLGNNNGYITLQFGHDGRAKSSQGSSGLAVLLCNKVFRMHNIVQTYIPSGGCCCGRAVVLRLKIHTSCESP